MLLLDVEGMKCAGCSGAVQRLLSAQVRVRNPNPVLHLRTIIYSSQALETVSGGVVPEVWSLRARSRPRTALHRSPLSWWVRSLQAHMVVHGNDG